MAVLSSYLPKLRRLIRDTGSIEHQEFAGDGTSRDFYLLYVPIESGTETVYLDDVETTLYVLDADTGHLRFGTAPGDGVVVKIIYTSVVLEDTTLVDFLGSGFTNVNGLIDTAFVLTGTSPSTTVSPDPTDDQFELIELLFLLKLKRSKILEGIAESYSYRTDGVSINKAEIARNALAAKADLEQDIKDKAWEINWNNPSHDVVLSGGCVPGEFGGDISNATRTLPNLWITDLENKNWNS